MDFKIITPSTCHHTKAGSEPSGSTDEDVRDRLLHSLTRQLKDSCKTEDQEYTPDGEGLLKTM
jgi:hypothetical protein